MSIKSTVTTLSLVAILSAAPAQDAAAFSFGDFIRDFLTDNFGGGHYGDNENEGSNGSGAVSTPEIDAAGAVLAFSLMGGMVAVVRERRRQQRKK